MYARRQQGDLISLIREMDSGRYTDRQRGDLISLLREIRSGRIHRQTAR
jgi:hypothetical protein